MWGQDSPRTLRRVLGRALGLLMVGATLVVSCAPPRDSGAREVLPEPVYVVSGLDGRVGLLDGASGRTLAAPLAVGHAPHLLVGDPGGALLVAVDAGLEYFSAAAVSAGRAQGDRSRDSMTVGQRLPLEDGVRPRLLTGDGAGLAVAAYEVAPPADGSPGRCRLAVVDMHVGEVTRTHVLCAPGEAVTGLAAARMPEGTRAYAALWRPAQAAGGSGGGRQAGARVVAVDVTTGAVVGAAPLTGQPRAVHAGGSLALAPGPADPDRGPRHVGTSGGATAWRLYAVEALPGPVWATWDAEEYAWAYRLAASWRLTRLTPDGLAVEWSVGLDFAPAGLAVAPDGAHAYAFEVLGDRLMEVDLASGRTRLLGTVPGSGAVPAGVAASAERVYAAVPRRNQVWVFDRLTGRRTLALDAGRFPVAVVAAAACPHACKRPRRRARPLTGSSR